MPGRWQAGEHRPAAVAGLPGYQGDGPEQPAAVPVGWVVVGGPANGGWLLRTSDADRSWHKAGF